MTQNGRIEGELAKALDLSKGVGIFALVNLLPLIVQRACIMQAGEAGKRTVSIEMRNGHFYGVVQDLVVGGAYEIKGPQLQSISVETDPGPYGLLFIAGGQDKNRQLQLYLGGVLVKESAVRPRLEGPIGNKTSVLADLNGENPAASIGIMASGAGEAFTPNDVKAMHESMMDIARAAREVAENPNG